jgi:hypothetical protein
LVAMSEFSLFLKWMPWGVNLPIGKCATIAACEWQVKYMVR